MFYSQRLAPLAFVLISVVYFSSVLVSGLAIPVAKRAQLCNGHADLCDRGYGNTTFLGAHDSFAVSGNPFALARDQEIGVTAQLDMGVRMLQAQAHMDNDELHFCHTTCGLFNGGTVEKYLKTVKRFLDRHPNEVLTLVLTNPERVSVPDVWKPIFDKTGMSDIAYIPPKPLMTRDDWPTLGEMIAANKRVVVFVDHGAERAVNPTAHFILPQFQMMWEDAFDPTDAHFPCRVDRTAGPLQPGQQLSLMNHNLNLNILGIRIPNRFASASTNAVGKILAHASHCAPFAGDRNPNFVMLDFVDVGRGKDAVDRLNGIHY